MASFNLADYDDVNSRIDKFWAAFPEGRILTDMVSDPNSLEEVVFKASIYLSREDDRPVSVGWAFEKRGKSSADKANFTHHVENSETSAIGRALANLNFKTHKEAPRPSRQEMEKINRYEADPYAKPTAAPLQFVSGGSTAEAEPTDTELFNICKAKRDSFLTGEQKANIWNVIAALANGAPETLRTDETARHAALIRAADASDDRWKTAVELNVPKPTQPTQAESNSTIGAMSR